MQLKSFSEQMESSKKVTSQLDSIHEDLEQSAKDTKSYKEEVGKLTQTVGELNTIYGNMLSAMNMGSNNQ